MKRATLAVLAALTLVPAVTLAQPPSLEGAGEPDPTERVEHLAEALSLDGEQQAAIEEVVTAAHETGRALREELKSTLEELREAREAGDDKAMRRLIKAADALQEEGHELHLATRAQIREQLTTGQQAQLLELEVRRHHRQQRMMGHVRERRGEEGRAPRGPR